MFTSVADFQIPLLRRFGTRRAVAAIILVSLAAFSFLFWLVYFKHSAGGTTGVIALLPAVNAGLNALTTVFLIAGYIQVKRRHFIRHIRFMVSALISSTIFLVCYITYHNIHGETKFLAGGAVRPIYFAILISHITLSAVALPLILTSFYLGLSGKLAIHKRVSRFTFPIWLYVSITGVLVFAMLKVFNR